MRLRLACLLAATCVFAGGSNAIAQCVGLTTAGTTYTQNFDTLSNVAGSNTNNLTLLGWFLAESGAGVRDNEQYAVDTGGSNTGDTYSYGAAGSTERALGTLRSGTLVPLIGACFTNNTGAAISTLAVAYTGEQWRLGTAGRTDQLSFEYSTDATSLATGTWTGVSALSFVTPDTVTVGAKNGNAAGERTVRAGSVSSLSIGDGATFWIRWTDADATSADDGLAVDEFSLTANGGAIAPTLSINDVALAEGNASGTTTFAFTVTLTAPAGPGGVTFDIATADGTAQDHDPVTEDDDYVARSLNGQSIPEGSGTYMFSVTVNGDIEDEPDETFFVNVTNIVGASAGDAQGLGTIQNDDMIIVLIHDIQGPGASSPLSGVVSTRGVVTGVRGNGFFIQEPDATVDADPATSEGILVFTGAAPPPAAIVGAIVQVTGTITEFVPASDLLQPPVTELTSPTVVSLSTGNPLPSPVPLTTAFPDPGGTHDQLERLEGMRVSVSSLTVVGPTLGNVNEPNATATSSGVFHGVATGIARPFREPGIPAPDPPPSGGGTIPPIPRFDSNPERIRVDGDGLVGGAVLDVGTGAVITGLVGPLDYSFRTYTLLPDPGAPIAVSGGPVAAAVASPNSQEFTVAFYNMQRFYDTVNDPLKSDVALTAAAFDRRLAKASLAVRDSLRMPDILAVAEIENLETLQALAARISADAAAASQPDPQYGAYLVEGNDIGGIDVGFLVKAAPAAGSTPRVTVNAVVQERGDTLFVNPDATTELLNDRPPLRLMAAINDSNGASFPVTVIANHLRSLNSVNSEAAGQNGWPTEGARVRAKRQAQAEDLAKLVQARQAADPAERIIVLGDFNAHAFNDGLGDSMNVIAGVPPPDNVTAVPGDGVDLVDPDLDNLLDTRAPAQRYSYVFDGNAQSLDHVLVNAALMADTVSRRIEHARTGADFAEVTRNDGATPIRLSDHDAVVGYFEVAAFGDVPPFGKLAPASGALDQLTSIALTWADATRPTSYEYCITRTSTASCDTQWTTVSGTTALVNGLLPGTTYAWQVRALDAQGSTTVANGGAWWTFTTQAATAGDADADGLPDAWEEQFGLGPLDGALGDPDGDGKSNIDELNEGTHPRGFHTMYFAEGATGAFFSTRLALANIGSQPAHVLLRFLDNAGRIVSSVQPVSPLSRATIDVVTMPGMESAEFATIIETDEDVVADRTMTWDASGYGSHAETGVPAPATTWYLAEGATHSGFNLFYLLQNPNDDPVDVEVRYLRPAPQPPITRQYRVERQSRFNIWVDTEGPELDDTDVAAVFTATRPIVVERAMYLDAPGETFGAGHASAGIVAPATSWVLAEGSTGPFFDMFLLAVNPGDADADVTATYLLPAGATVVKHYAVRANSRFNVWVDHEDPLLADTAVSVALTSTNDVPVVVERAMWWPGPTASEWREAHDSPGSAVTGTRWALAEGEEGGTGNTQTYVLIANTSAFEGLARVTLLYEDGTTSAATYPLSATSRFDLPIGAFFPDASGRRFATIVDSLQATGAPAAAELVVERAMYSDARGLVWAAGSSALATRVQ